MRHEHKAILYIAHCFPRYTKMSKCFFEKVSFSFVNVYAMKKMLLLRVVSLIYLLRYNEDQIPLPFQHINNFHPRPQNLLPEDALQYYEE